MGVPITITYEQAVNLSEEITKEKKQKAEEKLEEFLTSSLYTLRAADIHYYARLTGISANDLRRMHPEPAYSENMLRTFENDETDDIFSFY